MKKKTFLSKCNSNIFIGIIILNLKQSKELDRDQESIQSKATPDLGHHIGKTKTQENITYQRTKRSALSQQVTTGVQGTDKTVWQTNMKHK